MVKSCAMMFRLALVLLATQLLLSCVNQPQLVLPAKLELPARDGTGATGGGDAGAAVAEIERMPVTPRTAADSADKAPGAAPVAVTTRGDVNLNFEQVPLTTLIQVVYAEMLGRSVNIDPQVMERRDLVTFRTPAKQSPKQVHDAMQLLLKSYGIAALDVGGLVRVVPDTAQLGHSPEIRRGAALPETPEVLRPIFQMVELQAVRNTDVAGWIRNIFSGRVEVSEDATRNAVMLNGTSENVAAAMDAIAVLDQPVMRGRASMRIAPVYMTAEELAKRLSEVLAAEGYNMPPQNYNVLAGGARYPLLLLPIPSSNAVLVFSLNDEILAHVQEWAAKLDQPSDHAPGKGFFSYTAQNVSAEQLAMTMNDLMQGGGYDSPASGDSANKKPARGNGGRVVVDAGTNTLIFQTNADEYSQLIGLLRTLDRPSRAALIEVTVAELKLNDDSQMGIEWLLRESRASGAEGVAGTLGGLSIGGAGFTMRALKSPGDTRLVLNTLASSNRATILSSPRIMARNGEEAMIQVGQEVPIITSQQSNIAATNDNSLGVLQTVQYRSTGVILSVKPMIHPGDRIDLEVKQEVSAAQNTVTGVNTSPTIATRKIETKLTLQNGSTVLLGGLISNDESNGDAGIPGLKNIPWLGRLFKSDSVKSSRTELIVLITPYVVNDDYDAQAVTNAFKTMLPWLKDVETPVTP